LRHEPAIDGASAKARPGTCGRVVVARRRLAWKALVASFQVTDVSAPIGRTIISETWPRL
jgi:hypothetical protein